MKNSLLIAVGGNSLIRAGQRGTLDEQLANARTTARHVAEIASRGYRIVVTHGNGPQVGSQLLRSEAASMQTYALPLDVCVAMTQGEIGYILQNSLREELRRRGVCATVATVVTQVVVDANDPAFEKPSKPIGPFYSKEAAERKRTELGWSIAEDSDRGYRRIVPSPAPMDIVELDMIRRCLETDTIVIAAGGGGIPVVDRNGILVGVEAVIDKDRASSLLARKLNLERFLISTDVECVYLHYQKPDQKPIRRLSTNLAKQYLVEGEFCEGSMKPKIESALEFLESGGKEVIVTDPDHLVAALDGQTGTRIIIESNDETPPRDRISAVHSADAE